MITLNDYLYSGDTVFKILKRYTHDLEISALDTHNEVDMMHAAFLTNVMDLLEHNDFLTMQSNRIKDFYKYMVVEYPYLAFTFKGRIKSLIRAEEKFNGYVVEYIYDYYKENGTYPTTDMIKERISCFRDLIAYRIVISMPQCHLKDGDYRATEEEKILYDIANKLPSFLKDKDFELIKSGKSDDTKSDMIKKELKPYYRDYVKNPNPFGYQSLHITLFDKIARCYTEVQLRTKAMDDFAEIGPANHLGYEKRQEMERARRSEIPEGECVFFDEAYERGMLLQDLDLSKLDVNMFAAYDNHLINDGCGLYRGRQILPFEHLSRFQNDIID